MWIGSIALNKAYWLIKVQVRFLATLLLVSAAVYVVGGRYFFSQLHEQQPDLEVILSAALDRPVTMDSIEGRWSGFDPVIQLNGLTIEGERAATIENISFRIGLLSSIKARDLRFKSLEFLNTQFDAVQHKASWSFAGFEMAPVEIDDDAEIEEEQIQRWFEGANISFVETQIQVFSKRGDVRDWRFPGLTLRYQGDDFYASGQVVQPGSLSPLMSISVHGSGVVSRDHILSEVYLEARSVDFLDAVLQAYDWQGISVTGLDASGRMWADFVGTSLIDVQGSIQASRLDWEVAGAAQQPIRNLATQFSWDRLSGRTEFEFKDLAWQWGDRHCAVGNGFYHELITEHQIYIDALDIGCVNGLALAADLPQGDLFDRLDVSRPKGKLKFVDIRVFDEPTAAQSSQVAGLSREQTQEAVIASETTSHRIVSVDNVSVAVDEMSDVEAALSSAPDPAIDSKALAVVQKASSGKAQEKRLKSTGVIEASASAVGHQDLSSKDRVLAGSVGDSPPSAKRNAFTLEAELSGVALAAFESTPSASGIDGYVYADSAGGEVQFKSESFKLGFPTLFSQPWQTSYAQGTVGWIIGDEDVSVFSNGLYLDVLDSGQLYGDFSLWLNDEPHEDVLSLGLAFQDISFVNVPTLVPDYLVSDGLYEWLGQALVGGNVSSGIYYGHGSVESESAENSFTSSLLANARDGVLKFEPEWPELEDLEARIELQNDALMVVANQASIHGTSLANLVAVLPSAQVSDDPMLRATATTKVREKKLHYWMMESPISEHLSAIGEAIKIEGEVGVDIDILVPFDNRDVAYDVKARLANNQVTHHDTELIFSDVAGTVAVSSEHGVVAEALSLQLFDRPATVSIHSQDAIASNPAHTRVRLEAISSADRLLEHFELGPVAGLDGELSYTALLDIFASSAQAPKLRIQSDLIGLGRAWPSPFDKAAVEPELLTVDVAFEGADTRASIGLESNTAGRVDTSMLFNDSGLDSVDVLLGAPKNRGYMAPTAKGVKVHGAVVKAELQEWIDYIDAFLSAQNAWSAYDPASANSNNGKAVHDSDNDETIQWDSIAVNVGEMTALTQVFSKVNLTLSPSSLGWTADVVSDDIAGRIAVPTEVRSLSLQLDYLHLKTPERDPNSSPVVDSDESLIDPGSVPTFSFSTNKLVFDAQDYGSWSGVAVPSDSVLSVNNLAGRLGGVAFNGRLKWSTELGHASTYLEMKVDGGDSEQLFKALGKTPPISSDKMSGEFSLVWPSNPHDFDASRLSGSINLAMDDGFLKTPDKKTGALRLLGIFNAEALERRLKLDFSDLYKSGIGYDELRMNARINEGKLTFSEPMTISGPSSRYEIEGSSDLGKQTLNLDMKVELPLTSNVPLAALMLGAPQVGGAVWLVDKLLGSPLSSITSVDYKVSGTWTDPKMDVK